MRRDPGGPGHLNVFARWVKRNFGTQFRIVEPDLVKIYRVSDSGNLREPNVTWRR